MHIKPRDDLLTQIFHLYQNIVRREKAWSAGLTMRRCNTGRLQAGAHSRMWRKFAFIVGAMFCLAITLPAHAGCLLPQGSYVLGDFMARPVGERRTLWGNNDTGYSVEVGKAELLDIANDVVGDALQHAGLLPVGGYASIRVNVIGVPAQTRVTGSTANGVTSNSLNLSDSSSTTCVMKFALEGAAKVPPAPVVTVSQFPAYWQAGKTAPVLMINSRWASAVAGRCQSDNALYQFTGANISGFPYRGNVWVKGYGVYSDPAWVGHPMRCSVTATGPGGTTSASLLVVTIAANEDPAVCQAQMPAAGVYTARPSTGYLPTGNNLTGYTVDSPIQSALVHSGLLKPYERARIIPLPLYTQKSFTGSTLNGITSRSQNTPYCGMLLSVDGSVIPAPELGLTLTPAVFPASLTPASPWLKVNYSTQAANFVEVDCASDQWRPPGNLQGYHYQLVMPPQGPNLDVNGMFDISASVEDVGHTIQCTFTATGGDGRIKVEKRSIPITNGKPLFNISRTSANLPDQVASTLNSSSGQVTLQAGKAYHTAWTTVDATSLSLNCTSADGTQDIYRETLTPQQISGDRDVTAKIGWVGHPSACTWTASGPGGSSSYTETVTTTGQIVVMTPLLQTPQASVAGNTINLAATLPAADSNAATVTAIRFSNNNNVIGWGVRDSNSATWRYSWPAVPAGTYNVWALAFDANQKVVGAASQTAQITVTGAASQPLALTVLTPASAKIGETVSLWATLNDASNKVASVKFFNGATVLGNGTAVADGMPYSWRYRYDWPSPAADIYSIKAQAFDAQGNALTAFSNVALMNVGNINNLSLTVQAPALSNTGAAIDLAATLSANSNSVASVKFFNGATLLGSGGKDAQGNIWRFRWPAVSAGNYSITAQAFDAQGNALTSASPAALINVSTLVLTVQAPATSNIGAAIDLVATLSAGNGNIASVRFFNGGALLGTGVKDAQANLWRFKWSAVAAGNYSIGAQGFDAQSNPLTAASAVVAVKVGGAGNSTTSLSPPANIVMQGKPFTLEAQVTGNNPAGNISFQEAGAELAKVALTGGKAQLTSSSLGVGNHTITAVYAGDAANLPSTSASASVKVLANTGGSASDATPRPVTIPAQHLKNADAGTLPGELSVSSNGAANYSINIVTPPGTAGVQPQLVVSYNSFGNNGLLGLGWSLSGLSRITHCGKTIAQDGVNGRITFNNGDRLCLDGQRLVLVNGDTKNDDAYWSPNAEYRTELESFTRVLAQTSNEKRSFKVEYKDGRSATYGKKGSAGNSYVEPILGSPKSGEGAAAPQPKSSAQAWAVDTITDRAGNYIRFSYTQDPVTGEHKPNLIRYGGNGLPAHAAIQFVYEDRQDAWTRYIDETRNDLRNRISHIKTYVGSDLDTAFANANLVRDYSFSYEQSASSGRSLLNGIQACARNKANNNSMECLPKTSFTWGQRDPDKIAGFESRGIWAGAPVLTTSRQTASFGETRRNHADFFAFTDFNNDGFEDVLEKRVAIPAAERSSDNDSYEWNANPIPAGTLRQNYRYFHNSGKGQGFTQYLYQISTGEAFVVLATADFNGDGAPDLLVGTASTSKVCISPLAKPATLSALAPGGMITFTCDPAIATVGTNNVRNLPYTIDAAGDGRAGIYGPINVGRAPFCRLTTCLDDWDPPSLVLSEINLQNSFDDYLTPNRTPEKDFVMFENAVDLRGIGIPSALRFSSVHVYVPDPLTSPPDQIPPSFWYNLQPQIAIQGFGLPGSGATQRSGYFYPEYPVPVAYDLSLTPYMFDVPAPGASMAADFSGSGYNGISFGFVEFGYSATRNAQGALTLLYKKAEFTVCQSTGRALDCDVRQKYSGAQYLAARAIGNFVGDGAPAIIAEAITFSATHDPQPSGQFKLCRIYGDARPGNGDVDRNLVCEALQGLPAAFIPGSSAAAQNRVYFMDLLGTGRTQMVLYHDDSAQWEVFAPRDLAKTGQALDRIVAVTNGLGAISTLEYIDGLPGATVSQSGASKLVYPQRLTSSAGKIVRRITRSNGASPDRSMLYRYEDAAIDVAGRGALGFALMEETDEQTGIKTSTRYRQDWPYTSMVLSSSTIHPSGVELNASSNELRQIAILQAVGATPFAYIERNVTKLKDLDGSDLGSTTTSNEYKDGWGNLTRQTTLREGDGKTFTTIVDTQFKNANQASSNTVKTSDPWLIGLPLRVVTTFARSDLPGKTLTRTKSYEHDLYTGLLLSETIEPDNSQYKLTTSYNRDVVTTIAGVPVNPFGLVNSIKQSWKDPLDQGDKSRTTTTWYDANGRFAKQVSNALGHLVKTEYDEATGVQTLQTDANQLSSVRISDGFGRTLVDRQPNGNEARSYIKSCQNDPICLPSAALVKVVINTYGSNPDSPMISTPVMSYADHAGHELGSLSGGFDGRGVYVEKKYDLLGRLSDTYQPHFEGENAILASRLKYDDLNRISTTTVLDEDGAEQTTLSVYSGFKTVHKNPKNQIRTEFKNVAGQLSKVVDANNGVTQFDYELGGNLRQTIDPNGNIITVEYDLPGRKTDLRDPDLGWIHYDVDPLGQIRLQTSPRQRDAAAGSTDVKFRSRMEYDALGRMTDRYEPDLESHWVYDSAANGKGLLAETYTGSAAAKKYRRTHEYDTYSRPKKTSQTLADGIYTSSIAYDAWNRVITQTYQRNADTAKVFDTRYGNTGYIDRYERNNLVLAQVVRMDAAGHISGMLLGNGLLETHGYNPNSARLESIDVGVPQQGSRVQQGYRYDALGNVRRRVIGWENTGFEESFEYDALNRILSSKVKDQTIQIFNYDAAGNIKNKTGVGNGDYVYPPQGANAIWPHAVKSIPGIGSFTYDNNGNLTSGAGLGISWTTFDMPLLITRGDSNSKLSASFEYGPEHQRLRQSRGDGSKEIYGGVQVTEQNGDLVTVKTYWPAGLGVEIERLDTGVTQLNWTHVDHLGSVIALSDGSGKLSEQMAYDAWGKRRNLNGAPLAGASTATPDNIDGKVDNRGFTDHEMLDQLDLIHMNGRVYEPLLARFISADVILQDPMNGQSYNRYSYVLNNPTNLTDPTGFEATTKDAPGTGCHTVTGSAQCFKTAEEAAYHGAKMGVAGVGDYGKDGKDDEAQSTSSGATKQAKSGEGGNGINAKPATKEGFLDRIKTKWKKFEDSENASWAEYRKNGGSMADAEGTPLDYIPFVGLETSGANLLTKIGANFSLKTLFKLNPCKCFVAGTPIHTKDGLKPIETIQVGDLVATRSEETGETAWKPVRSLIQHDETGFAHLQYVDSNGESEMVVVTSEHLFMLEGNKWVQAGNLKAGDKIIRLSGGVVTVNAVLKKGEKLKTYNFEVADFHTYFVGEKGVWVHNACDIFKITSRIKESNLLVREAESAGKSVQKSLDNLVESLSRGNMSPGIGSKSIGEGISEARARDGARVYFRVIGDQLEILGKSAKENQQKVINEIYDLFGRK